MLSRLEKWEDHWKETSPEWKARLKQNAEQEKANKKLANKKIKEKEADCAEDADDIFGAGATMDLSAPQTQYCLHITGSRAIETWVDKLCWNRRGQVSWTKDHPLVRALRRGFGMHMHGAEIPEREKNQYQRYFNAVEDLFRQRCLVAVFSTESLSLGINMPIRTVVIAGDHPLLTPTKASQMAGRAGRRGLDVEGHVFCMNMPLERATVLMSSPVNDVGAQMSIDEDYLSMCRDLGGNEAYDRMRLVAKSCSFFGGDDNYVEDVDDEDEEDVGGGDAVEEEADVAPPEPPTSVPTASGTNDADGDDDDSDDDDWDAGSDGEIMGGVPDQDSDDVADDWDA